MCLQSVRNTPYAGAVVRVRVRVSPVVVRRRRHQDHAQAAQQAAAVEKRCSWLASAEVRCCACASASQTGPLSRPRSDVRTPCRTDFLVSSVSTSTTSARCRHNNAGGARRVYRSMSLPSRIFLSCYLSVASYL